MEDLRRIGETFEEDTGDWDEDGDGDGVYGFRGWLDACTRTSVLAGGDGIPEDPSTCLVPPESLLIRIRFLQKILTDSSTLRSHYRLAITPHSSINPISTLCSRPPLASLLLSLAIREQSSTETFSFPDPIRFALLLPRLGIKKFQNYTGSVLSSRQCLSFAEAFSTARSSRRSGSRRRTRLPNQSLGLPRNAWFRPPSPTTHPGSSGLGVYAIYASNRRNPH